MSSTPIQATIQTAAASNKPIHYPLSEPDYHIDIFSSVAGLPQDWVSTQPNESIFLHSPYLSAIEDNPPRGMRFSYLIFYKMHKPVGIAYCQISNFRPDASIKDTTTKDKYPCIIRAIARYLKNIMVGKIDHNLLVCGNLLLTGEHGFHFNENAISKDDAFRFLEEALTLTQNYWEEKGLNIDGIFIKDIAEEHKAPSKILIEKSFKEFTFHPNMILNIPSEWETFDNYFNAISSKYRVRAKRAFRFGANLNVRELTESQIYDLSNRLYELYKGIMDSASFNMVTLHENYLPDLKRNLGDKFKVFGYYLDGELSGYRTTITSGKDLDAHFLGFDLQVNKDSQIYLNMLFDTLKQGIQEKAERVIYSRTAMEIKSSVGAKDYQMYCYIRANNKLFNAVLPPLLEYLRPPDNWVPRNPFK